MKNKNKIVISAILLIPVIYIGYQIYHIMYRPYVTQTAIEFTMAETVTGEGIAVRDENVIHYDGGGVLGYTVSDSQRVTAGSVVGEIFQNKEQAFAQIQLKDIEQEIFTLEDAQNATAITNSDLDIIMKQTQNATYQMLDLLDQKEYASLTETRNNLNFYYNRLQIATGQETDFSVLLETLNQRKSVISAAASTPISHITAPTTGYFVSTVDGYEDIALNDTIAALSPAELQTFITDSPPAISATAIGKIENDYKWRFYVLVPNNKNARFAPGVKVSVNFLYTSESNVPAEIISVVEDDQNNLLKVELLCSEVNEQLVQLRVQKVEVSFKQYTGLRIDKKALHIINGVNGVYVRHGNIVQFKPVTPIYEDENYFLVPLVTSETNGVKLYDEVIIEGKDLFDGKLLS